MNDDWLAVDESGAVTEISPVVTAENPAGQHTPASFRADIISSRSNTKKQMRQLNELPEPSTTEAGDTSRNEFLYGELNELQQLGKEFCEANYAAIQKTVSSILETASSTSYSALDKLKSEIHRAISGLSETENDGEQEKASSEPADPDTVQLAGLSPAESVVMRYLLPRLTKSRKTKFAGRDFKKWFEMVSPIFEEVLPNEATLYLCGVKLYSQPSIASLIDGLNLDPLLSWEAMENAIDEYFQKYCANIRKYQMVSACACK